MNSFVMAPDVQFTSNQRLSHGPTTGVCNISSDGVHAAVQCAAVRPNTCFHALQAHYLLGLKILNMLVAEMNSPTPNRTLTQHRKIAVNFRDQALFKVGRQSGRGGGVRVLSSSLLSRNCCGPSLAAI